MEEAAKSTLSAAVSVGPDGITVDAKVLAPKLGLTPEVLQANMNQLVTRSETGIDEDEGRTRLTFRYGKAQWRIVIEPDGHVVEDDWKPSEDSRGIDLLARARERSSG
ncbi:MAG: DUF6522 family protein [Pseudomonadota bacterium]